MAVRWHCQAQLSYYSSPMVRFHACRYPVKPSDTAHKFDPTKHNHVVFVRKNKFFQVPLAALDGRELTAAELEAQIEKVISLAGEEKAAAVGALTSENRDVWADVSDMRLSSVSDNLMSNMLGARSIAGSVTFKRGVSRGHRVRHDGDMSRRHQACH